MSYSPGLQLPATSVERPPATAIVTAPQMRLELGVGADNSFDTAINEAVKAATEWVTRTLGYSPVAATRVDSYAELGDGYRLGSEPDMSAAMVLRYYDDTGAVQDLINLMTPLDDRSANSLAWVDGSDYRYHLALTPGGISASTAVGTLDSAIRNPVQVAYTEAQPQGHTAIRLAVKKVALAIFQQSPTEPASLAMQQAEETLLRPFILRSGLP